MIDLDELERDMGAYCWVDAVNEETIHELIGRLRSAERSSPWTSADVPPSGTDGCWTPEVVAVTNLGSVHKLAYYHGDHGGCWQRPLTFLDGEQVEHWLPMPK